MLKALLAIVLGLAASGCSFLSALDFGGDDKVAWEFHWGWEHQIAQAKPGTPNGGVDEHGVYKPETTEVDAILGFPNIHAGVFGELSPQAKMTPVVNMTLFTFKVPYARWFSVQAGAGNQLVEVYLGKRLVSVFEITFGPWFGWDFDRHEKAYGLGGTLIKF